MQELGKFNFKNIIPNVLEQYMNSNINNNLIFIDSCQFLNPSLDSLVKNFSKNDFEYLGQDFDSDGLDLVKQKDFYPDEYMSDFEKFKEVLPNKVKFHSSLTGKKNSDNKCEHVTCA